MSATIQWCDGPRPSVKRPSHTAWFDSACCAIAIGWRVWIGITAVPSSMRVGRVAHERDRGQRVEVVRDLRHPDRGEAGLLGRLGVGDEPRDLLAVAAPSRGRSSGRSAPGPLPRAGRRAATLTDAGRGWQCILVFREACLRSIRAMGHTRGDRTRPRGSTMSRVAVVTGAASGMGLAVGQRLAGRGHRVALLDLDGDAAAAAPPTTCGPAAPQALGGQVDVTDRGAVDEALGAGPRRARTGRDHGHERRPRRVRVVHRHHASTRGTACSR